MVRRCQSDTQNEGERIAYCNPKPLLSAIDMIDSRLLKKRARDVNLT